MLTVDDFIQKFEKYSDQELFEILQTIEGYNDEAKTALNKVIEKKGGIDRLINSVTSNQNVEAEIERIQKETDELRQSGFDKNFISKAIFSKTLSEDRLNEIINKQYESSSREIEDKTVDSITVKRCILSGTLAALISGSLLAGLLIYTGAIHMLIFVGVAILCYAIIKAIVKKSKNNSAVIVTTFISSIIAIILGFLIFNIIGPVL